MGRLKKIVLFLLVVITIYSTMLFYLLMSVHSDSRLQEIDYLQKSKPDIHNRGLYLDRLVALNQRLQHFVVMRVSHKQPKPQGCTWQEPKQAVLLVSASSFDTINIYANILHELEMESQGGCVPQVFVVKRLRPLLLNNQQNINKYASEVGEILKFFTIETQLQVSIFTHEEGAILTLVYLVRKSINLLFHNIVEKIRAVLLVDMTHPFLRIHYDPPYKYIHKLKLEIFSHQDRVKIFNKLKFVVVTTHKQDMLSEHFFYQHQSSEYVFARTVLISSREMANVHYFLPPNSLSFPPLVRRLIHFLGKDFNSNMTTRQISAFMRYGESHPHEKKTEKDFKGCREDNVSTAQYRTVWLPCIKVVPTPLTDEEVVIFYSPNHFQVYSDTYQRIYPFDNLTDGSVFLFQKLMKPVYVLNPQGAGVTLRKQNVASPLYPLQLEQEQIKFSSQLIFRNYTTVRICPQTLLTFPLHFAQGNLHRKFLGEGQGRCFVESSVFENFSWQLFLNWSIFRNMVIFTLMCSIFRKEMVADRLIEQFFINMLLLLGKDQIHSKITCGIYVVAFSILLQYVNKAFLHVASFFTIKQSWASFALLAISLVCVVGSIFDLFNYWKVFAISSLFFINENSLTILAIRLYFMRDVFPNDQSPYHGLTDLGLLTMWLYTSLHTNSHANRHVLIPHSQWSADQVFTAIMLFGIGLGIEWPGSMFQTIITIHMKLIIVLKMLRILRK